MILAKNHIILCETRYRYVTYGRNVRGGEVHGGKSHSKKIHSESNKKIHSENYKLCNRVLGNLFIERGF